jgi:short subunit fatty acids transporter
MEGLIQLKLEEARGPNQRLLCIIFYFVTQSILLKDGKTKSVERCISNTFAEVSSRYIYPVKTRFQYCCINRLVTAVQQYWAIETVNCFLEIGAVKYTPSHTAFL